MKFQLSSSEAVLLTRLGLRTVNDVLDYYRRTKDVRLEKLYFKTIGALAMM